MVYGTVSHQRLPLLEKPHVRVSASTRRPSWKKKKPAGRNGWTKRLTLNILLSFAQFERELIGERTRDKMSAARRKGKWVGGLPVLGYDLDPGGGRW